MGFLTVKLIHYAVKLIRRGGIMAVTLQINKSHDYDRQTAQHLFTDNDINP